MEETRIKNARSGVPGMAWVQSVISLPEGSMSNPTNRSDIIFNASKAVQCVGAIRLDAECLQPVHGLKYAVLGGRAQVETRR